MLRLSLITVVIVLGCGLLPANAQGGGDCVSWCRTNKCGGGMTTGAGPKCMQQCIAACQQKMKGKS